MSNRPHLCSQGVYGANPKKQQEPAKNGYSLEPFVTVGEEGGAHGVGGHADTHGKRLRPKAEYLYYVQQEF